MWRKRFGCRQIAGQVEARCAIEVGVGNVKGIGAERSGAITSHRLEKRDKGEAGDREMALTVSLTDHLSLG